MQHILDLHLKFALMPHHVWKYGRHPISDPEIRRGKRRRKKKQDENISEWVNVSSAWYWSPG